MNIGIYGTQIETLSERDFVSLFKNLKKAGVKLYFEKTFKKCFSNRFVLENETFNKTESLSGLDLLITIGGDGTILKAMTFVKETQTPILGINTGRLGFLTTVQKDTLFNLSDCIVNNQYNIIDRSLIKIHTPSIKLPYALNEMTLGRKNSASLITIKTYLDAEFLASYWADGLIISTPTGSTGYSLSCGGPVITPNVKSFVITPIAPHNLSARPLVIPDETEIKLIAESREDKHLITLDSRVVSMDTRTPIIIKKAPFMAKLAVIENESFLKTLRKKLLWAKDERN